MNGISCLCWVHAELLSVWIETYPEDTEPNSSPTTMADLLLTFFIAFLYFKVAVSASNI